MKTNEIYLRTSSLNTFVKTFEVSKEATNIIFIITPIVSVSSPLALEFMNGLINDKCNVFAMDFLGVGKSDGNSKDISYVNMKESLLKLIAYIKEHFNHNIHFYGGTGMGGILGQALCSDSKVSHDITSYIQYGVAIHNDLSIMGNNTLLRLSYPLVSLMNRFFPTSKLKFKIPKYNGFNAEKENEWYADVMKNYPGAFDLSFSLMHTALKLLLDKNSPLKNNISCPVLVIASKHDRYYYNEYINRYYESLNEQKEIMWIENSHLSFYWDSMYINSKVIRWVLSFQE